MALTRPAIKWSWHGLPFQRYDTAAWCHCSSLCTVSLLELMHDTASAVATFGDLGAPMCKAMQEYADALVTGMRSEVEGEAAEAAKVAEAAG